jgi:hypothetical protein
MWQSLRIDRKTGSSVCQTQPLLNPQLPSAEYLISVYQMLSDTHTTSSSSSSITTSSLPWPEAYASDTPQPVGLLCNPQFHPPHQIWNIPASFARRLHVHMTRETLVAEGGTSWGENRSLISPTTSTSTVHVGGIFYMPANLRHGTDGFTSPTKEGVLRNFSPSKIRRLRPGLNPRTLGSNGQNAYH